MSYKRKDTVPKSEIALIKTRSDPNIIPFDAKGNITRVKVFLNPTDKSAASSIESSIEFNAPPVSKITKGTEERDKIKNDPQKP